MWIRPQRVRLFLRLFLDLLFCRFDEMWSATRQGIICILPTRFSTVVGLHANHRSQYKKKRDLQPLEKMPASEEAQEAQERKRKEAVCTQSKTPSNSQRPGPINATKTRKTLQRIPSNTTSLLPLKSPPSNRQCCKYYMVLSVQDHLNKFPIQFSTVLKEVL